MTAVGRLTTIGFVAPVITHALMVIAGGPVLLVISVLSYPIMVVATFALLLPLHWLFARHVWPPLTQLALVAPLSLIGGFIAYLILFQPELLLGFGVLSRRLAMEYSILGGVAGLCCWVLYNWGPLSVRSLHSNFSASRREEA